MLLIIISAVLLVAVLLLSFFIRKSADKADPSEHVKMCTKGSGCCGGVNCQKKKAATTPTITYFDDHELDQYSGRSAEEYSEQEVAEFAEVYHTLRPEERNEWIESLRLRKIELPHLLAIEIAPAQ